MENRFKYSYYKSSEKNIKKADLEINYDKTEYFVTNTEEIKCLELEDDENLLIEGIKKFKYLGFILHKDGTTQEEFKVSLGQTRDNIRQLHPVIWIIRSTMIYGTEWWIEILSLIDKQIANNN